MMSWLRRTGVAAIAVLAVAGCSSTTAGKAAFGGGSAPSNHNSSGTPQSPTGSADTTPPSKTPTIPLQTAIIESHRMGVYLTNPTKILPGWKTCGTPSGPFPSINQAAKLVFGENADKVLSVGGYVSGWFQCYNGPSNGQGAVLGIMEAYDDAHAKALAQALTISASSSVNVGKLPGLPNAYLAAFPTADKSNTALNAILVRGRMLSYVYIDTGKTPGGDKRLDATKTQCAQLLKAQDKSLESFTPTPQSKLATLDDDPQLLDGKTAQPGGNPGWWDGGYTLTTYPEIASDAATEMPLLRKAGMTEAYLRTGIPDIDSHAPYGQITLYQLANAKAAKDVWKGEIEVAKKADPKPTGLPLPKGKQRPGAPPVPKNIQCLLTYSPSNPKDFTQDCWVLAGRYVAQVDLNWQADDSTAAHTRSKDSSRVLQLVNNQLKLTPQ